MSLTSTTILHTLLSADPAVSAAVSTWQGAPAIFTATPTPDDVVAPWIIVLPPTTAADRGTKDNAFARQEVLHEVVIAADKTGSIQLIETLSDDVFKALNRADLSGEPSADLIEASPGVGADTALYYGRVVTVRMIVDK